MNLAPLRANSAVLTLLACTLSLIISACEQPGSVGGSFTDNEMVVVVDSVDIGTIETDSVNPFTGRLNYFSAGIFDDPLFGSMEATGLIRPSLPATGSEENFAEDAEMRLKLVVNEDGTYGDPLQGVQFDLVEIDTVWRGKSWKLENQVRLSDAGPLATFEVAQQDSLEVPLPASWVERYREFYLSDASSRDSSYTYEFHGLALVPRSGGKIVSFNPSESQFIVYNPGEDTLEIGATDWAYSLQRSGGEPAPEASEKISSTLEHLLVFDLNLASEGLGTVNISRVDLVMYQNNEALNTSLQQVSASAVRPENTTARLHLIRPEHASVALDPGSPIAVGEYNEDDEAFHFNITPYVNSVLIDGVEEGKRFYVRLQANNGVIRSSLLYNHEAPAAKRPKLIVTSTKSQGN